MRMIGVVIFFASRYDSSTCFSFFVVAFFFVFCSVLLFIFSSRFVLFRFFFSFSIVFSFLFFQK